MVDRFDRHLRLFFFFAGCYLTLLGLITLYGAHTESIELTHVSENYQKIVYNTSLCFVLLGLSLITIFLKKKIAYLFIFVVLTISVLSLLQDVFGINLYIDELFFTDKLPSTMPNPGRMAPNTAFCFILSSLACWIYLKENRTLLIEAIPHFLGIIILAISGLTLAGYLIGLESVYKWFEFKPMAFLTALGFFGFSIFILVYEVFAPSNSYKFRFGTPISAGLLCTISTIAIWQSYSTQAILNIQSTIKEKIFASQIQFSNAMEDDINAFIRLAKRIIIYQSLKDKELIHDFIDADFKQYYSDFTELEKIEITKSNFKTYLFFNSDDKYINIYLQLEENNDSKSLMLQLDLAKLYQHQIMSNFLDDFKIQLFMNEKEFATLGNVIDPLSSHSFESTFDFGNVKFKSIAIPTKKYLSKFDTIVPTIILFLCLVYTILIIIIISFTQILFYRKKELENANQELEIARVKAENANLAKSRFLANMSHEIRTPLNGIVGTISLLEESPLNEKQERYLQRINSCSNLLLNLISDVLDLSKIEAGEMKLESLSFDLQRIIKEIADVFMYKTEKKSLELIVNYSTNLKFNLISDPLRIKQILHNLVGNAFKFTDKGHILISVTLMSLVNDIAVVKVEVIDTGIGIKAEKFPLLFQKFSQLDDSTTRKYGGTGLGLSIAKHLVEELNGRINVKSEEGVGSNFWFEIPFKIDKNSEINDPLIPIDLPVTFQNITILNVDSNPVNCEILNNYCKSWHATVDSTQSATEAFTKIKNNQNDQIITIDTELAEMSGIELAKKIKKDPETQSVKVILMSYKENPLSPDEQEFTTATLSKPICPIELYQTLVSILNEERNH